MRTFLLSTLYTMLLGLGMVVLAQEPGPQAPPATPAPSPGAQNPADTLTLTGCLAKGTEPNRYRISDQSSRQTVEFQGPNQLEQYVNQTGKMVDDGQGKKTFQPTGINPVSSSCT